MFKNQECYHEPTRKPGNPETQRYVCVCTEAGMLSRAKAPFDSVVNICIVLVNNDTSSTAQGGGGSFKIGNL